jgi:hypothetical protein
MAGIVHKRPQRWQRFAPVQCQRRQHGIRRLDGVRQAVHDGQCATASMDYGQQCFAGFFAQICCAEGAGHLELAGGDLPVRGDLLALGFGERRRGGDPLRRRG